MPSHLDLAFLVLPPLSCSLLVRSWWFWREIARPGRPRFPEVAWEGFAEGEALGFTHSELAWQRSWAPGQAYGRTHERSWRQKHGNVLRRRGSSWIGQPRSTERWGVEGVASIRMLGPHSWGSMAKRSYTLLGALGSSANRGPGAFSLPHSVICELYALPKTNTIN